MTLADLEKELDERGVSMAIHIVGRHWVVWLYPPDDPAQVFIGDSRNLLAAVREAIACWDEGDHSDVIEVEAERD